ncbi:MAG: GNAT family N-acetyltransferase [Rhodanobacter sp.]|jgi:RimJ/RimL family protein N-acetyltransferase|uniref:GNAT family N-acetyltransferase n=1 Tax=Rhodanobacter sp. KK11 TaxID=3083255 RepID=UPI002966D0C0|nr:GNAT family N-acetyltransferase [Rhodanobacter sp. KK11]MDW2980086.1 GNAT family N-acetyltransferase [Rhodanobacter sp. KK11]
MTPFAPTRLHDEYVVLEPLSLDHAAALEAAAADGELWNLTVTSVPPPGQARGYVEKALQGQAEGHMLPFAVREARSGEIVGSTRCYEIDTGVPRLAIGYTWYAKRWQKTHLNTACKRLLLEHAFETLGCAAVAFHTDELNEDSQRAIERLGAQREGVLRAHKRRTDGSLRNTVCFSILADEWPHVANWLGMRLDRLAAP